MVPSDGSRRADRPARRMAPQRRHEHLIDTALRLYQQRPPQEVSVDEIVAEAGVSRALFYRYFSNVGQLHVAALSTVVDEITTRVTSVAEGTLDAQLRDAIGEFINVIRTYPSSYIALLRTGSTIATTGMRGLVERVRSHMENLVLDRLGLKEPAPLLLITIRGWVSFVETILLTWVQNPEPDQERLENWFAGQLLVMIATTAEHDADSAEQLGGVGLSAAVGFRD